MAARIMHNRKNTSAVLHFSGANSSVVVTGNSTTTNVDNTSTCLAMPGEELTGVSITQAFWGIDPSSDGHVVVKRGSNVVAVYDSTGYKDYAGSGMSLTLDSTANLVLEFSSSSNAYVILEVQKLDQPAAY